MPHNDDPAGDDYAVSSPLSDVSGMSDDFEYLFPENRPVPPAAPPLLPPIKPVVIEISDDENPAALPKRSRQAETELKNQARHEHITTKWGSLDKRDGRHWLATTPAIRHQGSAPTPQLHTLIKPIQPPASYHNKSLAVSGSLSYHELPSFTRRPLLPGRNTDGGPNLPGLMLPGPNRAQGPTPLYPRGPNAPGPNRDLIPPHPHALNLPVTNRARTLYRTVTAPGRAGAAPEFTRLPSSSQFPTQPTSPAIFYGSGSPAPPPPTKPNKDTQIVLSSPLKPAAKPVTPQQATQAIPSSPPSSPELPPYAWLDKTGTSIARLHGAIRGVLAQGNEDAIRALARELRHDWQVDEMATYVEGFVRGALFDRVA
ncbi:hypothetical protein DFP73DRAFT_629916 [Morchella snyderi]|nr:hypothetical protein DFP73DRAFT_629916 [Morchella snyderi]